MENTISQEVALVKEVFSNIRKELETFMKDRNFNMSNHQIFVFLTHAPAALAIASDGRVDVEEMKILDRMAKAIDVNKLDIDLVELLSFAAEPADVMTNEEFNLRIGSELLYLSRNLDKYEKNILEAIKQLLRFDKNPEADTSLTKTFSKLMDSIIENNASLNKEKEKEKLDQFKQKIGL